MESLKVARPNGWMAKKVGRGVPAAGHAIHERESELSDALTYTQARRDVWLIHLRMSQTSRGTLSPIRRRIRQASRRAPPPSASLALGGRGECLYREPPGD